LKIHTKMARCRKTVQRRTAESLECKSLESLKNLTLLNLAGTTKGTVAIHAHATVRGSAMTTKQDESNLASRLPPIPWKHSLKHVPLCLLDNEEDVRIIAAIHAPLEPDAFAEWLRQEIDHLKVWVDLTVRAHATGGSIRDVLHAEPQKPASAGKNQGDAFLKRLAEVFVESGLLDDGQ